MCSGRRGIRTGLGAMKLDKELADSVTISHLNLIVRHHAAQMSAWVRAFACRRTKQTKETDAQKQRE